MTQGHGEAMKYAVRALIFSLSVGAAAIACREDDKPSCTAEEGESCATQYSACLQGIQADTEMDTDEEAAAQDACHDTYCQCLEWAGCEWVGCSDVDTGI
jgi:hypothetical protein